MHIDWLTVGAQIVNFLILVALLKRFLYRPVLDAMDRREQRIAQQLHDADQREQQADARAREFQDRTDDIERRRVELLERARADAEVERRDRLQEARAEVAQQRERWHQQLAREHEDLEHVIEQRLARAVTEAARRALSDLADADLEQAMSRAFQRRLASLADADRRAIADGSGPVEIATTFEPDEATRQALAGAVKASLGRDVGFVLADGLGSGIELRTREWKVSWTVDQYLRELEDHLADAIGAGSDGVAAERG